MKTRLRQAPRRFQLKLLPYGNSYYIERIEKLEKLLSRKPKAVQIDMVGVGEIPADLALLAQVLEATPQQGDATARDAAAWMTGTSPTAARNSVRRIAHRRKTLRSSYSSRDRSRSLRCSAARAAQ